MKTIRSIVEIGTFSLKELTQIFSELATNGCSLMIRTDVARQTNIFTCAISVAGSPEKSVRRDAETLNDAVIFCLREYLDKTT